MSTTADFARAYCKRYGISIVPLPPKTKRPLADDWGKHVITDPDAAHKYFTDRPDWNMGAALGPSRLCSFDVDDIDATRSIFAEFGWDLDKLRDSYPTIQGRPDGFRVMFRVPDGMQLPYHALSWPKKDGGTGREVIFEIRAAHEQQRQDVLPPSIHPDTGKPYIWLTRPDGVFPEPPDFLLQVWKNWDALKPQFQAVCPWAPKQAPKPLRQPSVPREGASVIETFNAANSIEAMLAEHGYKQQGKRWLSPHSGTGLPGVNIMDGNKCWIHHASDPLCSDESGQPVGPFDLLVHYQHGGDVRKAVRQAAEAMGMERKPQPPARIANVVDPETGEIVQAIAPPAGTMSRYQAMQDFGLDKDSKGVPFTSLSNISRVLTHCDDFAGKIWVDEFLCRICTVWGGTEVREWSDVDDIKLQAYLQDWLGMPKLAKSTVADAVIMVANSDRRNEAKAYIEGLKWDGIERLPFFFHDCFGVEESEYTKAAGNNFWLSMVARVVRPGCKVDTMIVLEGVQGAGKSKALSIIAGKWFAEAHESPSSKDFYLNLQGKMLIEIGEMDAFNRSEVTKVKQVITCQTDRFRAPYERHSTDQPRRCVFAGTTNRDDWNKDETGARRFWPVYCTDVRHDILADNRDQFFAEALAKLQAGGTWWEMPEDETKREQENRRDADELEYALSDWLIGKSETTVYAVMKDLLKTPLDQQDRALQMRVAKALRGLKWTKPTSPAFRNGKLVRVWFRSNAKPVKNDDS